MEFSLFPPNYKLSRGENVPTQSIIQVQIVEDTGIIKNSKNTHTCTRHVHICTICPTQISLVETKPGKVLAWPMVNIYKPDAALVLPHLLL